VNIVDSIIRQNRSVVLQCGAWPWELETAIEDDASNRAQGVSGAWYRLRTWLPIRSLLASLNEGWKKLTNKRDAE